MLRAGGRNSPLSLSNNGVMSNFDLELAENASFSCLGRSSLYLGRAEIYNHSRPKMKRRINSQSAMRSTL